MDNLDTTLWLAVIAYTIGAGCLAVVPVWLGWSYYKVLLKRQGK